MVELKNRKGRINEMINENLIKKSNIRAWLVVFTGFTCFFTIYGSAYNCLGLFMKPMAESFDVPRAVISSLFTVMALCGLIVIPMVGRYMDKYETKWLLLFGSICMSLTYIIWATAPSLPFLYLGAIVESFGISCTINMPVAIMIKNWFVKKQGFATGTTVIGAGAGGAILSQVVSRIISVYDWQTAYLILAVLIFVTTVPLILLFARKDPYSIGLYRYGETNDENFGGPAINPSISDRNTSKLEEFRKEYTSVPEFFKRPEFYLMFVGLFFFVLPTIGVKSHIVAYLTDLGHDPQIATSILTICLLASIPGAPLVGACFDKLGTIKTIIIAFTCLSAGMFLLASAPLSILFPFIFSVIYGAAVMLQPAGVPLIFTDMLRTNHNFATIMSVTAISMSMGSAFGTLLLGLMYDIFDSYVLAFIICGFSFLLGFVMILSAVIIAHQKHKKIEKQIQ